MLRQAMIRRGFLTKELYVDLLKCMHTAELVQFMVDLVEDESLVIVSSIVLHYIIHWEGRRNFRIGERRTHNFLRQTFSLPEVLQQILGWHAGKVHWVLPG